MDIRKGWNDLQNKLYEFNGYKGLVECAVFFNCVTDTFDFTFDVINRVTPLKIYCGWWSKKAEYHQFYMAMCQIKNKYFLFTPDDLSIEQRKKQVNGCGSGWNANIVPEFIFHPCCCRHDARYFLCNVKSDKNRKWIDTLFLCDMKRRASGRWWYVILAYKFFLMVRMLGGSAFRKC